ncbi:hypothetical protein EVAR_74815_1 [Eumeta japonica]|uniref:Uncharacterized protein n=1 Tax=Eumeta variegata TaxID=151549 RepID=A0A4C1SS50_EUMVA|nr:hypothetical protein EVAR_74815_1 [Eumeta japonica]
MALETEENQMAKRIKGGDDINECKRRGSKTTTIMSIEDHNKVEYYDKEEDKTTMTKSAEDYYDEKGLYTVKTKRADDHDDEEG